MKRMAFVAVIFIGTAVAFGCGGSSENEAQSEAKQVEATKTREERMITRRKVDVPRHIRDVFGVAPVQLSRTVLDTLRSLKALHGVTRDEAWQGEGGVLANPYFEVWYTEGATTITHAMRALNDMMLARQAFIERFGGAPDETLVILLPPYMETFEEWTGREFWHYSHLQADTMVLQPVPILKRRGLIEYAIPHEYIQWAMTHFTGSRAPRWFEEGMASFAVHEGFILEENVDPVYGTQPWTTEEIDRILADEASLAETRAAYYKSYRLVEALAKRFGEAGLNEVVSNMNQGMSLDASFQAALGVGYDEATEYATGVINGI